MDWRPFKAFVDKLRQCDEPKTLVERLLLGLVELLGAEQGFVLLGSSIDELQPITSHGLDDADHFITISRSVCTKAMEDRGVVFVADSMSDRWYLSTSRQTVKLAARSIICGPLQAKNKIYGVIYVDGPVGLTQEQIPLFEAITALAAELLTASHIRNSLLAARTTIAALNAVAWEGERLILGDGETGKELKKLIEMCAPQDVSVLITGETGTGKEMVARAIHRFSSRREAPFVPVNCAALPREIIEAELFGAEKGAFTGASEGRIGRFELAARGTLFLDELGELPLEIQVKLLRSLQEKVITRLGGNESRPTDFRLVCATNVDLEQAIHEGTFRQDLYYRINVFRLHLRPLRERVEDIVLLTDHFVKQFAARFGRTIKSVSKGARELLRSYQWPGNIRELRNAIERAILVESSEELRPESLPIATNSLLPLACSDLEDVLHSAMPRDYEVAKEIFEKVFFERSLETNKGKVAAVARETGLTRKTIYAKLQKLGLSDK